MRGDPGLRWGRARPSNEETQGEQGPRELRKGVQPRRGFPVLVQALVFVFVFIEEQRFLSVLTQDDLANIEPLLHARSGLGGCRDEGDGSLLLEPGPPPWPHCSRLSSRELPPHLEFCNPPQPSWLSLG